MVGWVGGGWLGIHTPFYLSEFLTLRGMAKIVSFMTCVLCFAVSLQGRVCAAFIDLICLSFGGLLLDVWAR